jgi:hypothetical protein
MVCFTYIDLNTRRRRRRRRRRNNNNKVTVKGIKYDMVKD